jgi:hypothetical protein
LIAIAIGGTITFIVINKYVVNKEDEWKDIWLEVDIQYMKCMR